MEFKMKGKLIALSCAFTVSACSSIMEGSNQNLAINTLGNVDKAGTTCTFVNDKGQWYSEGRGSTSVKKSNEDMIITCENDRQEGQTFISSNTQVGYAVANFFLWDLCTISCIVDHTTGALYKYPTSVQIPMNNKASVDNDIAVKTVSRNNTQTQ